VSGHSHSRRFHDRLRTGVGFGLQAGRLDSVSEVATTVTLNLFQGPSRDGNIASSFQVDAETSSA
jgi:hypothetical protein